jgi:hypothetical protein
MCFILRKQPIIDVYESILVAQFQFIKAIVFKIDFKLWCERQLLIDIDGLVIKMFMSNSNRH